MVVDFDCESTYSPYTKAYKNDFKKDIKTKIHWYKVFGHSCASYISLVLKLTGHNKQAFIGQWMNFCHRINFISLFKIMSQWVTSHLNPLNECYSCVACYSMSIF